ncbi:unnamed protein product [Rotaria socialis]|uniref:Protein artemis n=1 Tax=Rotaria socialis TaxID=392032 RepID=A0A820IBF8_9BILA|nr:unnamed protein product [Rotaria socialis]CAF3242175.1 unnamed protein product [Rotaria socialis]CAF3313901.1 unnamed protein product [Rotaria socialis]CAF4099571.1 unnamed protein product [Rotaria socialis]CAF4308515.1 unnamed protein product [Rotaria socialis]
MCTYHGILEEYPLISIDSFESHNYTSTMFFISHIHMDHLIGLERPEFGRYVAKINAPIYMSDISKQLLSTIPLYRHLVPYFKSVPIDQPFTLTIQSNDPVQAKKKEGADMESLKNTLSSHAPNVGETIVVTCFGSGHCPGSIMVWIEGQHGNVLFTGDFRLYHGQAKRLTHLHRRRTDDDDDDNYIFKPIDNIYIDMTFFRPEILHIPKREVSCEALILWIKDLLADKSNVNFHFKQSARVGYEQIFRALYDSLGMRVHVEQSQYEFFSCLPIIQECLTTDPTTTRLHACRTPSSNYTQPCSLFRNCDKPIRILLSIMWFTEQISASELLVEYHEYHSNFDQNLSRRCIGFQDYGADNIDTNFQDTYVNYRLCYSLHSSFSEIVDVLKTLKPKCVTPIAAPLTTMMTTKRLFQIIDHFIQDNSIEIPMVTIRNLNEKMQRKSINQQIQLKHRYESFETKLERKRRRKLFKEQQQRKANDEELDLGIDEERDHHLLQRIDSLNESIGKKIQTNSSAKFFRSISLDTVIKKDKKNTINGDQQINISVEESTSNESISSISEDSSNSLSIEDIRPINDNLPDICSSEIEYISSDQQFVELTSLEDNQESTMSDSSSDTVDYDFDTEICAPRTFESQECMIPLSTCHDREC